MLTLLVLLAVLPAPRAVELCPQGAPNAKGTSAEDRPAVTPYLPAPGMGTGAGILVLPGGGFTRRCEDHEGVLVAEWLRAHGIAAFLVRYRVVPIGTLKDALGDVHRAVRTIRADEWGVSPSRLGAVGFSAGSYLAAEVALRPRAASATAAETRRRPTDAAPIEVEIRPGAENRLDLEVSSR
jgi:acetyl esterase/lipase